MSIGALSTSTSLIFGLYLNVLLFWFIVRKIASWVREGLGETHTQACVPVCASV